MTTSDVTVIVPTFNRATYINECIDSLLAQTVAAREIIVVDDGSDDDTSERIARYGSRVRYVFQENGGKASAVNRGVELAAGSWIWILDDDDVALPEAIECRLAVLGGAPDADFVYASHHVGRDGPDGTIVCGRLNACPEVPAERFLFEVLRACFFSWSTTLAKRSLYQTLGGFDSRMVRGQDYDFQTRAARVGKPVYCPDSIFIARQHDGIRGTKSESHAASDRGMGFRKFSLVLGQKLRADLTLGEYCVPPRRGDVHRALRREALLNRAQVMANHGCVAELFVDLREYLDLVTKDDPVTHDDRTRVERLMRTGWAYRAAADDWPRFVAQSASLRRHRGGRVVQLALAEGLLRLAISYRGGVRDRLTKAAHAGVLALRVLV